MDLDDVEHQPKKEVVKVQKCQPFEPIRKAVGNLIGINSFSSPAQQLTAIKNATEFAESFDGLSFLFSVDTKEESEEGDARQMSDIHVLAQSLSKMFVRMARKYHKQFNKKLVILFEDMEYADKNSLDMIRLLVKIFAASYKTVPIIITICYRELPNSDDNENNEGKIQDIVDVANIVAKRTGGTNKLKTSVNMLLDKQADKLTSKKKIINEDEKIARNYKLTGLTVKNLESLLQSLAFLEEEVSSIASWLHTKSQGKLYWVSACLQNLFIEQYVESSLRGWKIVSGKTLREISVPNKMAKILEVKFRKMEPQELRLLQIAAESGMNFNSNLLAKLSENSRISTIYTLNSIQREYNVITENQNSALRNDQGNDTLSGEFTFSSIVYIDALKSLTRNYGINLLYAKQVQLKMFDLLFSNVNMSQLFLNSFFFYMNKYEFEYEQGELEFSLEQRWGNAYIEIINFRRLPLEFKFRLADHATDSCLERPFEALIAFTMAALTAKDLWDTPNIIKYCELAINEARSILQNKDEIDELYEWLKKIDRSGFTSEDEILNYVRRLLSELLIIESQNKIESDPKKHSKDIVEQLNRLEMRLGKLPPKARVIKALAYVYLEDLEECKKISSETYNDPDVIKLYKADACYSSCFAGYKSKNQEDWVRGIKDADNGVAVMLEYIKETKCKFHFL